jgi:hypothetical protein
MSSSQRKHRGDSKLKTLKEPMQLVIIEKMKEGKIFDVIKWVRAECGISTSGGALSEFWSWWHLRQQVQRAQQRSGNFEEMLRARQGELGMTEDEIIAFGNRMFIEQGVESGDAKLYAAILDRVLQKRFGETNARLKERKLQLDERRIKILEAKAATADKIEAAVKGKPSAEMTPDERAAVLRVVDESFGFKPKA